MKLSVIIPTVLEFPQVLFTVRAVLEECKGLDFEVVVIDNYCEEVAMQCEGKPIDRSSAQLEAQSRYIPQLTYLKYQNKLSHWQAKNVGCKAATGDVFLFLDSHTMPSRDSIQKAFQYFAHHREELNGTLHLPLSYHIMENKRLIYKMVDEQERGWLHYSFTGYRDDPMPYEVPCMSTCGMFMGRDTYAQLGGFPTALGIYGGGENFVNYCLSVIGKKKWIFPGVTLHHHGDKRGYHWNYDDHLKNKAVAMYCVGGLTWLKRFFEFAKGRPETLKKMQDYVIKTTEDHCKLIEAQKVIEIEDWINAWK